eukprot:COSAG04_NODE_3693_length_2600_cov_3.309476_5_plen_94_part_00
MFSAMRTSRHERKRLIPALWPFRTVLRAITTSVHHSQSSATSPAPSTSLSLISTPTAPCPHDHCCNSWKNAPQMPAKVVRLTVPQMSALALRT